MTKDCNENSVFCSLKTCYIKIYKINKYINFKVNLLKIMLLTTNKGLAC